MDEIVDAVMFLLNNKAVNGVNLYVTCTWMAGGFSPDDST